MEGLKRVAVICILRNQTNFLLLKRFNEPLKGLYVPVGGKVDPYENPYETALREVKKKRVWNWKKCDSVERWSKHHLPTIIG
jgi:8-oxo-dGTP diphosphatase